MENRQKAEPIENMVFQVQRDIKIVPLDLNLERAYDLIHDMQFRKKHVPASILNEMTVLLKTLSQEQRDEIGRIVYDERQNGGLYLAAVLFKRLSGNDEIPKDFNALPNNPVVRGLIVLAWKEPEEITKWINNLVAPHTMADIQKLSQERRKEELNRPNHFSETMRVHAWLRRREIEQQEPTPFEKACLTKLTHRLRKFPQPKREEVADFVLNNRDRDVETLAVRLYSDLTDTFPVDPKMENLEYEPSFKLTLLERWEPLKYDENSPCYMETRTPEQAKKFYDETYAGCRMLWRMTDEKAAEWAQEITAPRTPKEKGVITSEKTAFNAVQYAKTIIPHTCRMLFDKEYRAYYYREITGGQHKR